MNKGSVLITVAVLVTVGLLGGFYLKSKGKIDLPINTQTIPQNITSDKMTLSVSSDISGLITGKTSAFAEVFINDQEVKADANGNFKLKLTDLVEGENNVTVTANDSEGNVVEQNLTITLE